MILLTAEVVLLLRSLTPTLQNHELFCLLMDVYMCVCVCVCVLITDSVSVTAAGFCRGCIISPELSLNLSAEVLSTLNIPHIPQYSSTLTQHNDTYT